MYAAEPIVDDSTRYPLRAACAADRAPVRTYRPAYPIDRADTVPHYGLPSAVRGAVTVPRVPDRARTVAPDVSRTPRPGAWASY